MPRPGQVPLPAQAPEQALPKAAPITGRSQLNQALGLGGDDDILDPEDAFRFDPSVAGPDRLHLLWGIADGTYLYQDKLHIAIEGSPDVALGAFEWPAPEIKKDSILPDGSTGDVAVYHGGIDVTVPLQRGSTAPAQITLVAKYQGCAERGLCYPPITKRVTLDLPAAAQAVTLSAATPHRHRHRPRSQPRPPHRSLPQPRRPWSPNRTRSPPSWPAATSGRSSPCSSASGCLLAFTPCVFPMIPILSGIIAGHGAGITTRKAFTLSLVYVLAMAADLHRRRGPGGAVRGQPPGGLPEPLDPVGLRR